MWTYVFIHYWVIPSRTAGSYDKPIVNFIRNGQAVFQHDCIHLILAQATTINKIKRRNKQKRKCKKYLGKGHTKTGHGPNLAVLCQILL